MYDKILDINLPKDVADTIPRCYINKDYVSLTVRDYIKALAMAVIVEEESFSGKRPFGDSGWLDPVLDLIPGEEDDDKIEILSEAIFHM